MNYLDNEIDDRFLQAYMSNSFSVQNFILVNMFYRPFHHSSILPLLAGNCFLSTYDTSLSSGLSQSYVSTMTEALGLNFPISPDLEDVSIAIDVWETAYLKAVSDSQSDIPPFNYFQMSIIGSSVSSASGTSVIEESNYLSRNIYIFEVQSSGILSQIYPLKTGSNIIDASPYDNLPDECKFGKEQINFTYSSAIQIACYVMFGFAVLCCLMSLIFVIIHQNHKLIRSFGRSFSYSYSVVLLGLSFSMLFFISYPEKDNNICMWRVIYLAMFTRATLSLLITKAFCTYKAYKRRNHEILKVRITFTKLLSTFLIFIFIEIVLLLMWGLIQPNEYNKFI